MYDEQAEDLDLDLRAEAEKRDPDEMLRYSGHLTFRVGNQLSRNGIYTLRQLSTLTRQDASDLRNIGVKALAELDHELDVAGLGWAEPNP